MRLLPAIVVVPVLLAGCSTAAGPQPGEPSRTDPSTAAASASATSSPAAPRTATVTMSGDLLWHDTVYLSAQGEAQRQGASGYDFGPMFAGIKPILTGADLSICHEEVPVTPPGRQNSNYPVFVAPPETVDGIKQAGFKACTTASNHSWDQGFAGITSTLDALDARGIPHVGTARNQAEYDRPLVVPLDNGLKIGIVEGAYSLNGFELPAEQQFAWTPWDADVLLAKAKATRAAGADVVVVAMHGGEEYNHLPTAEQEELARKLTASPDVDLVYGHHVHVVQPITKVNGKWVAYGTGNLVAQMLPSQVDGYEGIITRFTFSVDAAHKVSVTKAEYIPVSWNYNGGGSGPIRIVPDKAAAADPNRADQAKHQTSLERTRGYVRALGVDGLEEA